MKEYWYCVVGPLERDRQPMGADFPMRLAVKAAFEVLSGKPPEKCSSGWGVTEDIARQISFAGCDEDTKKCLIESYYSEGKKPPRHMRAWELLLNEEKGEKS